MSTEALAQRLYALPAFKTRLRALIVDSVRQQFTTLSYGGQEPQIDLSYMLSCASILAQSSHGDSQDAAFRIAQYALTTAAAEPADNLPSAGAFVLEALTSHPAIKLARERGLLPSDYEQQIPFPLTLDIAALRLTHSIIDRKTDTLLPLNRFQMEVHHRIRVSPWISASAPTSAGKSFIMMREVEDLLLSGDVRSVVFLVPTRALIQEVQFELQEHLRERKISDVEVSSIPTLRQDIRQVFVFTQERLHWLLSSDRGYSPDLLVVDEAHKIGDGPRGILLQQVLREIRRRRETRVFFASPMTANPQVLLQGGPPGLDIDLGTIRTEQISVNQNLIWVSQTPRKPTHFKVQLSLDGTMEDIGTLELPHRPTEEV